MIQVYFFCVYHHAGKVKISFFFCIHKWKQVSKPDTPQWVQSKNLSSIILHLSQKYFKKKTARGKFKTWVKEAYAKYKLFHNHILDYSTKVIDVPQMLEIFIHYFLRLLSNVYELWEKISAD